VIRGGSFCLSKGCQTCRDHFPDAETKRRPGVSPGRFSGKVLKNGEHIVSRGGTGGARGKEHQFTVLERRRMKSKSRRYEVLLPVRFNDGIDVPEELLGEAVNEIVEQFNAASFIRRR